MKSTLVVLQGSLQVLFSKSCFLAKVHHQREPWVIYRTSIPSRQANAPRYTACWWSSLRKEKCTSTQKVWENRIKLLTEGIEQTHLVLRQQRNASLTCPMPGALLFATTWRQPTKLTHKSESWNNSNGSRRLLALGSVKQYPPPQTQNLETFEFCQSKAESGDLTGNPRQGAPGAVNVNPRTWFEAVKPFCCTEATQLL